MSNYSNFSNNVPNNPAIVEYGKAIQLIGDTRFPDITSVRIHYPDNSAAFFSSQAVALTSYSIYPKHAQLTYVVNAADIPTTTNIVSGGFFNIQIPSTGQVNTTAPLSAIQIGFSDINGKLQAVSDSNPLPMIDAYVNSTNVTWTNATTLSSALTVNTAGYDGVGITIITSGTVTGGQVTFQVWDGANWLTTKIGRCNTYNSDSTYTIVAGVQAWQADVAPFTQFRVILSSVIVGSGSVLVTEVVSSAPIVGPVTVGIDPTQPLPAGTNNLGSVVLAVSSSNFVNGQATIASTGVAVQLTSNSYIVQKGVNIGLSPASPGLGYIGASGVSASTGVIVTSASNSFPIPSGVNLNTIYVNGTTGQVFYYGGS